MAVQAKITADEFLQLPESQTLTELIDGEIIVSPAPEPMHQIRTARAYDVIKALVPGGIVLFSPIDVYLSTNDVVQPDVLWISPESNCKIEQKFLSGAPDLVVEVLSPSTALRDKQTKFRLYEKYGVREYWIVEPTAQYIEVWSLVEGKFTLHGVFGAGETFTSAVLGDKSVAVSAIFGG